MTTPRIVTIVTPSGPLTVIRPVAEQLIAQGVISGSFESGLHAADAATVKAAIMATGVCDFCSVPGATNVFEVPDFDMPGVPGAVSTGGWAACDPCAELVRSGNKKGLLERSLAGLSFPKFSRVAIQELHDRFWQGMKWLSLSAGTAAAFADFIEDRLAVKVTPPSSRDKRIDIVARTTSLTIDEIEGILAGKMTAHAGAKLERWYKGAFGTAETREHSRRQLVEMLLDDGPRKPMPPDLIPHWQRALDARFGSIQMLQKKIDTLLTTEIVLPEGVDLQNPSDVASAMKKATLYQHVKAGDFIIDVKMLRAAETYSFNPETISAITEAAKSIPHDSPLSSIETPNTGAGWFWFGNGMPVITDAHLSVRGLLWGWDELDGKPAMRFSIFVANKGMDKESAMMWYWPLNMSLHEMLGLVTARQGYFGPEDQKETTAKVAQQVIADLSLFFLASCMWFKQKILTQAPAHVERHARKRMMKEHKLKDAPSVRVIALRASAREPAPPHEHVEGEKPREYHYRWIVRGHPRLQPVGPGRAERKLIWIDPYPKGPEDKPLKTSEKVYAVIR